MVIFGGLELVAAGYVLRELHKDEEKPRSSEDRRRRHRHDSHSHSHSHSHHRRDSDNRPRPPPPRPDSLAPPMMPPLRPNSAPPQQTFQPRPGGGGPYPPGPWMNQMPMQHLQQQPQQQQRPPNPPPQAIPHSQTWPRPNNGGGGNPQNPPNQNPNRPMYLASDFPPNPNQQQQQQQPPPPGPGNLAHRPTMHFDMKTGKWQSDMLPPEMPRSDSAPVILGPSSRDRSSSLQPPSRLRQELGSGSGRGRDSAYSSDSYSHSSSSDSSDNDANLAYGSLPGERRQRRRHGSSRRRFISRERQRPAPTVAQPVGGSRDFYGQGVRGSSTMPAELPHQMRYELQG